MSDFSLVAWNWSWWEYLHHKSQKLQQIRALFPSKGLFTTSVGIWVLFVKIILSLKPNQTKRHRTLLGMLLQPAGNSSKNWDLERTLFNSKLPEDRDHVYLYPSYIPRYIYIYIIHIGVRCVVDNKYCWINKLSSHIKILYATHVLL